MVFRFVPAFARMSGKSLLVGAVAIGLIFLMVVSGAPLLFRALEEGNFWPFLPLARRPAARPFVLLVDAARRPWRARSSSTASLGFKHYLSVTEGNRLDRMHPPADTPELFEHYLPYAIALDVENRWAERFTSVLAAASATPAAASGFAWYSGSDSTRGTTPAGFTNSIGSIACQHDRARPRPRPDRRAVRAAAVSREAAAAEVAAAAGRPTRQAGAAERPSGRRGSRVSLTRLEAQLRGQLQRRLVARER